MPYLWVNRREHVLKPFLCALGIWGQRAEKGVNYTEKKISWAWQSFKLTRHDVEHLAGKHTDCIVFVAEKIFQTLWNTCGWKEITNFRTSDKNGKGMVEKRFALSGTSSVFQTDEAPERAKPFSTIRFPSMSDVLIKGNAWKHKKDENIVRKMFDWYEEAL